MISTQKREGEEERKEGDGGGNERKGTVGGAKAKKHILSCTKVGIQVQQ